MACLCLSAGETKEKKEVLERITNAKSVLDDAISKGEDSIPRDLLEKAHCVVIVPSLKRGAFFVGAQYGGGVALCRGARDRGWTGPSNVRMEGGSFGLQFGGGETDMILLVMNDRGAKDLMESKFTLGGEGAVMAGPVGRAASAETDAFMRAEILSYSHSNGVFAGVAIKGSTLRPDDSENAALYGRQVSHRDILTGKVPPPKAARALIADLKRYSPAEEKGE
ncbi:MAG: lipid-binding SYLF domain-containing protein [Bryobacterales bacterium]|nr:lipid-binding SYLF domain-containing protein [Bryobacterales bacterium]